MQLMLEALTKIKDTSAETLSMLKCVESENVASVKNELQDLFVQTNEVMKILDSFSDIRSSLESAGYSDAWYEQVFSASNIKDLCEIEMPKFLDNSVNRGHACMEGILETIKNWCKKAYDVIVKIIDGIIKFMEWLNKMARQYLRDGQEFKRKSLPILDAAAKKLAENLLNVTIEDYFDFDAILKMIDSTELLVSAICPTNSKGDLAANAAIFNADGLASKNNDELKRTFFDRLVRELQVKGVEANDMSKNGFVLKYDGAINKYIVFVDENAPDALPKKNINIATIKDEVETIKKLVDQSGQYLDYVDRLVADVEVTLKNRKSSLHKELNAMAYTGDKNDPATDTVNTTKANIILTICGLSVITDTSKFMARLLKAYKANQDMHAELVRAVYDQAQKA